MKIAIVDTYYPDFIQSVPLSGGTYEQELQRILDKRFGTFDAYSRGLRACGHEVVDIIANHEALQKLWAVERGFDASTSGDRNAIGQLYDFNPDVVFLQDLSLFNSFQLEVLKTISPLLAGQCSCRFDDDEKLKQFDVLFSSFPFHVERFEKLGVKGVFLPLAFDPVVIEHSRIPTSRTHAVSFVGGYGRHWDMDPLFVKLAEETPIQFWGYGFEKAPKVVRDKWHGPAWGVDMYDVYLRSHIVINRHGGISQGLSNNLRMFEATGCGAMLMTEHSPNIGDYFAPGECVVYESPQDAVEKVHYFLAHPDEILRIASNGQQRTLSQHTYSQRMPIVSRVLQECLDRKSVSA
jgi:spore maturation protein CgeB